MRAGVGTITIMVAVAPGASGCAVVTTGRAVPEAGATSTEIAGRQSVVQVTDAGDFGECGIDTGGIPFGAPQQDLVEIAEVFGSASDQSDDTTCQLGTAIASAAWPKLPAST